MMHGQQNIEYQDGFQEKILGEQCALNYFRKVQYGFISYVPCCALTFHNQGVRINSIWKQM